uniref:Putative product n=1 Tax=Xenopsylla cheopis TaxID=163159 RepID=A0A6M2DM10_XENCH
MASNQIINLPKKDLEVRTNWRILNGKTIDDAVSITKIEDDDSEESATIDVIVTLESCLQLEPNPESNCIVICHYPSQKIDSIHISSGARYVEIYIGPMFEYYKTFKADFYDDFDDVQVYNVNVTLDHYISDFMIKFIKISTPDYFWIYGITLIAQTESATETDPLNTTERSDVNVNKTASLNFTEDLVKTLKGYIDTKFKILEDRMVKRLDAIENSQLNTYKCLRNLEKLVLAKASTPDD